MKNNRTLIGLITLIFTDLFCRKISGDPGNQSNQSYILRDFVASWLDKP